MKRWLLLLILYCPVLRADFLMESGTFNCPASTGSFTQNTTFTPKALFMFVNQRTSDGTSVGYAIGFGMATTSGFFNYAFSGASQDAAAAAVTRRTGFSSKPVSLRVWAGTIVVDADFTSLNSSPSGFTLLFNNVTSGLDIHYVIWGGSDITNAIVISGDKKSGTGDQDFTSAGFQPDFILLATSFATFNTSDVNMTLSLGAATSSSNQWATAFMSQEAATTMNTARRQETNRVYLLYDHAQVLKGEATLATMLSNGFRLNYSTSSADANIPMAALCLKGGRYAVGSFNQATGTGNSTTTGTSFIPKGELYLSANQATATGIQAHNRISLGVGISSSDRRCIWAGDTDNVADAVTDQDSDTTKAIKMMTEGTPTVNAAADFVAFTSTGRTLNWTTADGTAREILFASFGATDQGGLISNIRRRRQ